MVPKILPASDVRNHMAQVLRELREEGVPCFVTQNGRAVAAMLSIEQYEKLVDAVEDYLDANDEELQREIEESERDLRAGKTREF